MAEDKYNMKNPSVKRILQELKEMQSNPSDDFMSLPLEENIFEWQFAIGGPRDSEFEGGIYHGRIQLPAEYPLKPPAFMLLTPNGRFQTQTKICLSISNHHPEHWQPSWSVRTALVALIAFMPTKPDGALGSLEYTKEERHALAIKSREASPKFGNAERQKLIDEIHEYMLSKAPPVPKLNPTSQTADEDSNAVEGEASNNSEGATGPAANVEEQGNVQPEHRVEEDVRGVQLNANAGLVSVSFSAEIRRRRVSAGATPSRPAIVGQARGIDDRFFTLVAVALVIAIVVLLSKKYLKASNAIESEASNNSEGATDPAANVEEQGNVQPEQRVEEDVGVQLNVIAGLVRVSFSAEIRRRCVSAGATPLRPGIVGQARGIDYRFFTLVAVALVIAIVVLLSKKYLKATGHGSHISDL